MSTNLTNRAMLVIIANTLIVLSFSLGWFFNSTTPTFYPLGTPIPMTSGCDLLSSFTHLCFPSIIIPISVGTIVLNIDILITIVTLSGLIFGLVIFNKEIPG